MTGPPARRSTLMDAHTPDAALEALFVPFAVSALRLPQDGRVLFLRARDGFALREQAQPGWRCEQSFKPFAAALERSGLRVAPADKGDVDGAERYPLVLILPTRQRDERRALFARAARHRQAGGIVLACVANAEGAKSAEADFARLFGPARTLSKHKCRVFWNAQAEPAIDPALLAEWSALDAPRLTADGYLSRPGLFAWDRIDPASALLTAHLPGDLHGRVADLGAGYGYLASQVVARCPQVSAIDLYEAEARALEPARVNLARAVQASGREVAVGIHWRDVAAGLEATPRYDAIVSNPPFHLGRADLPELGRAFIASAADALQPDGRLFVVANRHLPYEEVLVARFSTVRELARQDGYKVIEARGVRA
jgi:16S rRNA (guanine1207-N2)-methyltransferase